ncbi:MAG: alpha/beta fold hydrolase [Betaproteobacteria bacterium]|jgi:polyhydroxyalkanoate synthase|nr:alpha/beta fold hydrolase [Betaproteobacteria bacterium]
MARPADPVRDTLPAANPPPLSAPLAWLQWWQQLALAPGRQARLAELALSNATRIAAASLDPVAGSDARRPAASLASNDRRFEGPAWQQWPFNVYALGFSLQQSWWREAARPLPGLPERARRLVEFGARQMLEAASPANFPATNPDVLAATVREGGANLLRGGAHLLDDLHRMQRRLPPAGAEAFRVGATVATTPGQVVFRNRLIELIQYSPKTPSVQAEPVLIVPGWIMKYYILDLSPANSLVDWLVRTGYTVFMVSWLNPDARDRELSLDDYLCDGLQAALRAVGAIVPGRQVHAAGYCLGGTLLAIGAAAMARDGVERIRTLSLFAAQTDFSEPGELELFTDEAQLRWLEDEMQRTGYLDSRQMAAAFALLRSGDLVWTRAVREYLLGRREPLIDLMAWNADGTRMPARMHAEYLRALYQRNDLAHGRLRVAGRPVSITDIRVPVFMVATVADHVAPWQSVYQLHRLTDVEVTFALTTGGHNAGVVNPPPAPSDRARRHYQIATRPAGDLAATLDAQRWRETAPSVAGSWWTPWQAWLARHGSGESGLPPLGHDGLDYGRAPGAYVRQP